MNLPTLPSQTTTLNTMMSPSMTSTPPASPPTTTAWISHPEGDPKDACTTDRDYISVPIWACILFILFIALSIELLIDRIGVAWELETSQQRVACLESGQALNRLVAGATVAANPRPLSLLEKRDIWEQAWAETYQQDASRLMRIRSLAENANNALVLHNSTVHYKESSAGEGGCEGGYSRAANFMCGMLQREFERKYGVLSFQIQTDAEGKYMPGPLYGPDKSLQESERWFEEGEETHSVM
ncbi:hypothetical protein EAF04_003716 [Stromatinia cepivora]|nr:hypothetical protein EAF04_003716 [Stromatinia cepivora]